MKTKDFTKCIALLLCVTLVICTLSACDSYDNFHRAFFEEEADEEDATPVIKIGIFEPTSGDYAQAAADEIEGFELAHEMFGQVMGYRIDLVYSDNKSDSTYAASAAQYLVDQGCTGVLGSYSGVLSLAGSDIFKENKIPAVAATCTIPILTSSSDYYFRVCYINTFDAEGAADYIVKALDASTVSVLIREGNEYDQSKADAFTSAFNTKLEALGKPTVMTTGAFIEVYPDYYDPEDPLNLNYEDVEFIEATKSAISVYSFDTNSADYDEILAKLAEEQPGAVYFPVKAEIAVAVIHRAWELGYDFNWIGTDLWKGIEDIAAQMYAPDSPVYEETTDAAIIAQREQDEKQAKLEALEFLDHVAYTLDYDSSADLSVMSQAFLSSYKQKFGQDATPSDSVALGFDAYLLLYSGIRDAGGSQDGDTIIQRIYETEDLAGATGTISINSNGDPIKNILVEHYAEGSFIPVYTAYPDKVVANTEE